MSSTITAHYTPANPRAESADLIARLADLYTGRSALLDVVALGTTAVPALANELLFGRLQSVSEPRCRVVEALAMVGARDVILPSCQYQ